VDERFCPHCGKHYEADAEFCNEHGTRLLATGAEDDLTGSTLNEKYVLTKQLGKGAFGSVYEALHLLAKTKVAVKVLHSHLQEEPKIRKQFLKEARVVMELKSQNIVRMYDVDEDEVGRLFIVMELMDGMTLKEYVGIVAGENRRMPADQVVLVARQVCEALDEAHDMGVVHRDLKPANVMVLRDRKDHLTIRVVDFGIARLARISEEGLTVTETSAGSLVGTPYYMSPEQCMGKDADPRSDLYCLGVMMYELLNGKGPFKTTTAQEMLIAHATRQPEPPDLSASGLSDSSGMKDLVMKLLEKERENRYQSAAEVMEALKKLKVPVETATPAGPAAPGASSGKKTALFVTIPVVLGVLGAGGWALMRDTGTEKPVEPVKVERPAPAPAARTEPTPAPVVKKAHQPVATPAPPARDVQEPDATPAQATPVKKAVKVEKPAPVPKPADPPKPDVEKKRKAVSKPSGGGKPAPLPKAAAEPKPEPASRPAAVEKPAKNEQPAPRRRTAKDVERDLERAADKPRRDNKDGRDRKVDRNRDKKMKEMDDFFGTMK